MKKILSLTLVFCICILSLLSCSKLKDDPLGISKALDEDYAVEMCTDNEEIEDFGDEFDIKSKGVYCILTAYPDSDDDDDDEELKMGWFVFCDKKKTAKEIEDDFNDLLDDEDYEDVFVRATVERKGKVVFIGCEDVLDDLK